MQANSSLLLISSRSFIQTDLRLTDLAERLESFSNLSSMFVSGQEIVEELANASRLLQRVINISEVVSMEGMNVSSIAGQVRNRITRIQRVSMN